MRDKPKTRKKLSMKTRLILILIVFVAVILNFELGTDRSDDSKSQEEIETECE